MTSVQPTQAFYSLTLQASSAPTAAVLCNVLTGVSSRDQQIFEARGSVLYLKRVVPREEGEDADIVTIMEHNVFSIVRGVGALRIPGSNVDHLLISTDAGRLGVYEYDQDNARLKLVKYETYGKSGIRRTIPGQYMSVDPRGRCAMLASAEKNKLVYIFQRVPDGSINISSPHEANTWATLTFDVCALNVGWEHPVFAVLEVDYSESESDDTGMAYQNREKLLSYYTVDLGLNHVVRTWSESVDYTANKLFALPGGTEGPSGVIVCAKGRLYYKHEKFPTLSVAIPRRTGPYEDPNRDRIIVCGCLWINRSTGVWFMLLQTEDGDVFKLSMDFEDDTTFTPQTLHLKYYDTMPVASSLLLIRVGYVYVAAEHGDASAWRIISLGDDPEDEPENNFNSDNVPTEPSDTIEPLSFKHRGPLFSQQVATDKSLHPLIRSKVENVLNEDTPQVMVLQGSGNNSKFKMIKHGISVTVDASYESGNAPYECIWALPGDRESGFTKYIVITSKLGQSTTILGVEGDDINGLDDTPFITNRATVLAALMGQDTFIQVHARGIHSILGNGSTNEWPTPAHRTITCAAANERQLLLGLSSGELQFFFMSQDGVLSALEDQPEMSGGITAIGLAPTPVGRQQARFGVVGCDDNSVRVISIELDSPLEVRSIQGVTATPVSVVVTEMVDADSGTNVTVVHLGLQSGIYLRAIIDDVTGELSQTRSKFLGTKPVKIFPVEIQGQQCVIMCTSRPWIGFSHPITRQYTIIPLATGWLEAVTGFSIPSSSGIAGCANNELRFLRPDGLEQKTVTDSINLQYTPRNLTRHPTEGIVYVIESDGNTMSMATQEHMAANATQKSSTYAPDAPLANPKAPGHWASCIQILDVATEKSVLDTVHLDDNEAALSCAIVVFESKSEEPYLVVGTGRDMNNGTSVPGANRGGGFVRIYKLLDDGKKLELLHKTEFAHPIYALTPFKGRMAMGIGSDIFLYDLGTAHILRKGRGHGTPNTIVTLETMGNRLICGDVSESVTFVVYNEEFNRLVPFVDDTVSRWTTCAGMIDYDTIAGGDKFGNLWVVRCPESVSRESDDQGLGGYIMNERPYMGGTPYRLESRAHYYCQDVPMSVQKTVLVPGGLDVLFWAGIQGTLGFLVPFASRQDVVFFTQLELQMRQEDPPVTGRDHLAYRSYYSPVRSVIDGDLCERFLNLHYDKKQKIAAEVEREISDIEKKIQDMRTRYAW